MMHSRRMHDDAHRRKRLEWWLARYRRRHGGDELAALEAYQRDVEEHLADVEERIRRVRDRATG